MEPQKHMGTIVKERGHLFLEADGEKWPIPGPEPKPKDLELLVGKKVEVFYSRPAVVAFRVEDGSATLIDRVWWKCYVPPPELDFLSRIDPADLVAFSKIAVEKKVITPETQHGMTAGM
jgi:hypothetical protein